MGAMVSGLPRWGEALARYSSRASLTQGRLDVPLDRARSFGLTGQELCGTPGRDPLGTSHLLPGSSTGESRMTKATDTIHRVVPMPEPLRQKRDGGRTRQASGGAEESHRWPRFFVPLLS